MFTALNNFNLLVTRGNLDWLRRMRMTQFETTFNGLLLLLLATFLVFLPILCLCSQVSVSRKVGYSVTTLLLALCLFSGPARGAELYAGGRFEISESDYALLTAGNPTPLSASEWSRTNGMEEPVKISETADGPCIGVFYYNNQDDSFCFADFRARNGDKYNNIFGDENYDNKKATVYVYTMARDDARELAARMNNTGVDNSSRILDESEILSFGEIMKYYSLFDKKRFWFIILAPIALVISLSVLIVNTVKFSSDKEKPRKSAIALSATDTGGILMLFVLSFVLKLF